MALLPSNQRDQTMVLIALVAMVAAGAYWYFFFDPRSTARAERTAHVERMETANMRARAEIARGDQDDLKRQAAEYRENLELMRRLVPTENELPALLEQVSTAARRTGLDIATVEPIPVVTGEEFDTYRYRLSLTGGYHRIGQFLTNVGSLTRIVAPVNLQLETPRNASQQTDRNARSRRPSPGEAEIATRFEIQTFVAKASPSSPGAIEAAYRAPIAAVPVESAEEPAVEDSTSVPVPVTGSAEEGRLTFHREVFTYSSGGRRDPFASLMSTEAIRPLVDDLRLVAVAYDATGQNSVAILRDLQTSEQYRVRVGQQIGRLRVARIGRKDVTFTIEEFGYSRQETLTVGDSATQRTQQ